MSKAFTDKEKEFVKERLKRKGSELFCFHGIKKTSIDEITKSAGIGRGTFYLFYPSKEEFFLELVEETETKIKEEFIMSISASIKSKEEALKDFIKEAFMVLEKNPLMKMIMNNRDEFEAFLQNIPPQKLSGFLKFDTQSVGEVLDTFVKRGIKINIDNEVFSGILRGVLLLSLHKDLIGETVFPDVIETLAGSVAETIVKQRG